MLVETENTKMYFGIILQSLKTKNRCFCYLRLILFISAEEAALLLWY